MPTHAPGSNRRACPHTRILEFWAQEVGGVCLEGERVFWNRSFNKRAKRVVRCAMVYTIYIVYYSVTKLCIILYTTLYSILSFM